MPEEKILAELLIPCHVVKFAAQAGDSLGLVLYQENHPKIVKDLCLGNKIDGLVLWLPKGNYRLEVVNTAVQVVDMKMDSVSEIEEIEIGFFYSLDR